MEAKFQEQLAAAAAAQQQAAERVKELEANTVRLRCAVAYDALRPNRPVSTMHD